MRILVTSIAVLASFGLIAFYTIRSLGLGITMRHNPPSMFRSEMKMSPLGMVYMFDPHTKRLLRDRTEIRAYDGLYGAMGVTAERMEQWQGAHGMDSLGVDPHGNYLAPGYPVFSKVAWMFVDPVDLSQQETLGLVSECDKLIAHTNNQQILEEVDRIRNLAVKALDESKTLRFGHP